MKMGIEENVGNKDNALQLRDVLNKLNLPDTLISDSIKVLERSYTELYRDISGRYYSGCCI